MNVPVNSYSIHCPFSPARNGYGIQPAREPSLQSAARRVGLSLHRFHVFEDATVNLRREAPTQLCADLGLIFTTTTITLTAAAVAVAAAAAATVATGTATAAITTATATATAVATATAIANATATASTAEFYTRNPT